MMLLEGAMMTMAHWVHDWDPVIFRINEQLAIRWYGVAYLSGFVVAAWLLHRYFKAGLSPLGPKQQENALFAMILGVMIGGRLGYMLLYSFGEFIREPIIIIQFWKGGMASHGGFAGVFCAILWIAREARVSFLRIADIVVTLAPPGLFFGRLANFINGELWGKVSDVPWAIKFPLSAPEGTPVELIPPRHPSQLYEAALEGVVLFLWVNWRFRKTDVARRTPGRLGGEFLFMYSVLRILGEVFREPDRGISQPFGLSRGIFYSLLMALAGILVVCYCSHRAKAAGRRDAEAKSPDLCT